MQKTLIDAGPVIALFDRDDKYHKPVKAFLADFKQPLISTWPVITEVTHMLDFNVKVQIDFLEWISREAIQLMNLETNHILRLIELTRKYSDVPMDLADGSLIVVSELTGIKNILTIDSDYYIYRTRKKQYLTNLLTPILTV